MNGEGQCRKVRSNQSSLQPGPDLAGTRLQAPPRRDAVLVREPAAAILAAFGELVRRQLPAVLAIARRMLQDDAAEMGPGGAPAPLAYGERARN